MEDIENDNSCIQVINDANMAFNTFLNPKKYFNDWTGSNNKWGFAGGINSNLPVEIKLGKVWSRSLKAGTNNYELKEVTPNDLLTKYKIEKTSAGSDACNINYAVREAYYDIRYSPDIDPTENS